MVVLIHGRPATFGPGNQALAGVDALLAAWRPGEAAGNAIARLLFGDVSPSARLTQAWVQAAQDVHSPGNPWFQPFQADGGTKPNKNNDDLGPSSVLFPFGKCNRPFFVSSFEEAQRKRLYTGFGLSYTEFRYSPPTVLDANVGANSTFVVHVTVQNVGNVTGAAVVQIYASAAPGLTLGVTRAERWLVGYAKLSLTAGQKRVAAVSVSAADLGRYDSASRSWVVDPGRYSLFAQECAGSRWDGEPKRHPLSNVP